MFKKFEEKERLLEAPEEPGSCYEWFPVPERSWREFEVPRVI